MKQEQQRYSEEAFLAVSLIYLNQFICPAVQRSKTYVYQQDECYNNNNCSEYSASNCHNIDDHHPATAFEEAIPSLMMDERRLRLLEFQSDIETADRKHEEKQQLAKQFLEATGELLANVDRELAQTDTNLIGSAIVRGSREIADACAQVANAMEEHQDRRALTEAGLQDFSHSLQLLDDQHNKLHSTGQTSASALTTHHTSEEMAMVSQQEMDAAMKVLADLLRDIEVALRGIQPEEADEIAEVALSVAQVFIIGLQQVHAQITPDELVAAASADQSRYLKDSPQIEVITDEDGVPEVDENIQIGPRMVTPTSIRSIRPPRLRCLWTPVAPAITDFLHWSTAELSKQHWSVQAGLGFVLWPYAVGAALVSAPALVADHLVQQTYDHFADSPVVSAAEVAAGQVGQTARLSYLTARAVARPAVRVAQRQVQRHGPGAIQWTQDKIQHPVQTLQEAGCGVLWCSQQALGWLQDRHHEWSQGQPGSSRKDDAAAAMMNI